MKRMKKLSALLLALVMALALSTTAFADNTSYTITINGAANGETYRAYKLFDVSWNGNNYAYTIESDSDWKTIVEGYKDDEGNAVFTLTPSAADENTWIVTVNTDGDETDSGSLFDTADQAAAFAQYLADKVSGKTADGTAVGADDTATINVTAPGYYFVDTTLGSLCMLDTAADTVNIYEKNTVPSITKQVWEDSESKYQEKATVDVIDTVKYQLTVNTGTNNNGVGNATGVDGDYTIVDTLPAGMAYDEDSIQVKCGDATWIKDTNYTVAYSTSQGNSTMTIVLKEDSVKNLQQNSSIVITYEASITANNISIGQANENTATLTYQKQTSNASAKVFTFQIGGENFTKKDGDGADANALQGVGFVLSKTVSEPDTTDESKTNLVTYYAVVDQNNYLTQWLTQETDATTLTTGEDGRITVKGLDEGEYILTETEPLDGYNPLNDTITVKITENGEVTYKLTSAESAGAASITVVNKTGSELPSTGGMGTTVLYIVGAVLVLGAGVLLVVKRRMNSEK